MSQANKENESLQVTLLVLSYTTEALVKDLPGDIVMI